MLWDMVHGWEPNTRSKAYVFENSEITGHGLKPTGAADRIDDRDCDGYTELQGHLDSLIYSRH